MSSAFSTKPLTVLPRLHRIQKEYKVILASGSPRRKELLEVMGIKNYEVVVSDFPENLDIKSFPHPADYCLQTAIKKVEKVAQALESRSSENLLIIGADTIVCLEDQVLEKPKDSVHSKQMVSMLSGKVHSVHTAVVLFSNVYAEDSTNRRILLRESFVETTKVQFANLSMEDIEAYVETNEGLDKAGSYGIQGFGGQLVEGINGCYFNVMGLPIHRLSSYLSKFIEENTPK